MIIHVLEKSPIPADQLALIADMLRRDNTFVGILDHSADWFDPQLYAIRRNLNGTKFTLLIDRNVFSRTIELATAPAEKWDHQHRLVAAVFCFAHCCRLRIDETFARLEQELEYPKPDAGKEALILKAVSEADPVQLAAIALGMVAKLDLKPNPACANAPTIPPVTERHRPRTWNLNYGCALRQACLLRNNAYAADVDRMIAYMNWCYKEYFFSPGATVYGSYALSPKRASDLFKRVIDPCILKGTMLGLPILSI